MFVLMKIGSCILFLSAGIIPKNIHRKKVNFTKPYIIIPNHKSYIDAATIYTALPKLFKTLGKKELEKTPLYGRIFKTVCISVDRSSLSARALSFRKMKEELENGLSIVIFPEGTFKDVPDTKLVPFQDGAFTLSVLQQTDLLPVLFLDAVQRMHPFHFTQMSPGMNRAVFLPPVSVSGFKKSDVQNLKEYTQQYMQSCTDYILEFGENDVWNFATQYQKNNAILPV